MAGRSKCMLCRSKGVEPVPAVPVHHTDTTDKPWDGPAAVAKLQSGDSKAFLRVFAWYDASAEDKDGDGYPDAKSAWKLPHHEVDSDGKPGAANINACRAAIAALNGARGGVDIPASDKKAVYEHLAAHLKDAGIEPPALRSEPTVAAGVERRSYPLTAIEVRQAESGAPVVSGYAAVFNQLSAPLYGFREQIAPGAFQKSLTDGSVIKALWNHNPDYPLGSTKNGTLKLAEDEKGLQFDLELPNNSWGQDALESIRRGDVDGVSFGFVVRADEWDQSDPNNVIRTLKDVQLIEISPTPFPAYPQTSVTARSVLAAVGIDYDRLTSLVIRSQRGLPLTAADREVIEASIEVLRGLAGQGACQRSGGAQERIQLLRRRLELAAKSI